MNIHFSSKTNEWITPQYLFDALNKEFNFNLDAAATKENAKCERYFTIEQNSLIQSWENKRVFCNPPYGRIISKFVEKMADSKAEIVVGLLPARTDTKWFHKHILGKAEIRFLKGRLKFSNNKNNAPFPSMICIWETNRESD